jgi:glycosyltransferase 2 family protein
MTIVKALYMLLGVALLAFIVYQTDLADVGRHLVQIGWGAGAVLTVYLVYFSVDSLTWLIALQPAPLNAQWFGRLWRIRLVGEAFNAVIPAGGMGGEPVKAVLLKKHYGIDYRAGIASAVLAKTVNMLALIIFLALGLVFVLRAPQLSDGYKTVAVVGLAAVAFGTLSFFAAQRLKLSSAVGTFISARGVAVRLKDVLHHVEEMEDRFVAFYTLHRARFVGAALLALINWIIGAVEIYVTLWFLDHPVSPEEAWMIEAMAQMVRAGTFFIPSSLGAQEGVFLVMISALTGSPSLGVAVAVVRRFRELVWIGSGFVMGTVYSLTPTSAREAVARAEKAEGG